MTGMGKPQNPEPRTQNAMSRVQHSVLGTRPFPEWEPSFQAALERLSIAVRRPARGQHAGQVRSRARGRALEFADYRPYAPGDDPKLVDWRAYTRLGRLYLKQYDEERTRTITLLVDTSASLDWGDGDQHKGLYARRLAAALAWIGLSHHEPVQIHLLRDGSFASMPSISARAGAVTLFRRLGEMQEGGKTNLSSSIRSALSGRAPGPVLLLTDLMDPNWSEALDILATTSEGAVVQLLAPSEWDPPLGEEVELEDAETGELRATRLGPMEIAAYRERLDAFLSRVRQQCHRLGLIHLALNTATPLPEAVLRQLTGARILTG